MYKRIFIVLVVLFLSIPSAKSVIIPLYDPNAVHFGDGNRDSVSLNYLVLTDFLKILERSSNPAKPADGEMVIWLSDGSGYGDTGDVMIASSTGGAAKYGTLFDYSVGNAWVADTMVYEGGDTMLFEDGETMIYE